MGTSSIGQLSGLGQIAADYDVLLCDIWGVLHNGVARHAAAVDALRRFRQAKGAGGGHVALVTNMPRPLGDVIALLERLDIGPDAYDAVVSSGDVSRAEIARHSGHAIRHVGSDNYASLFAGIDVRLGANEEASAVVVTDVDARFDGGDMYDDQLRIWLSRGLPMICANPDKIVEVGGALKYCAGALADRYASRGGEVVMAGKPHAPIYELALAKLNALDVPQNRILAIGDAVRTDAIGAAGQGIDFLFVSGSVHAAELEEAGGANHENVAALLADTGVRLAGHLPTLCW